MKKVEEKIKKTFKNVIKMSIVCQRKMT